MSEATTVRLDSLDAMPYVGPATLGAETVQVGSGRKVEMGRLMAATSVGWVAVHLLLVEVPR